MKLIPIGSKAFFERKVEEQHLAQFEEEAVHQVCSTFQIAQDAEWVCRLFVHQMKESIEEGIGVQLSVQHVSPALLGSTIQYEATLTDVKGNLIIADWEAFVGERKVAYGTQSQKILLKSKLESIFAALK